MTILMGVSRTSRSRSPPGSGSTPSWRSVAPQMTWADAMGLIVIEGLVILVLVLTGFRTAVFHAVPSQLKVAISVGIGLFIALHRLRRRRLRAPVPDAAETTVPVELGPDGFLLGLADAGLRARARARGDAVGTPGARRDPDLDHRDHDPGHDRRGDRRHRRRCSRPAATYNPTGWGLNVPKWPSTRSSTPRTSRPSATSASAGRSRRSAWCRPCCWSSR